MNKEQDKIVEAILNKNSNYEALLAFFNECLDATKNVAEEQMSNTSISAEEARYIHMKYLGAKDLISWLEERKLTIENSKKPKEIEDDGKDHTYQVQ